MSKYVTDTMAFVLHLEKRKMPPLVKRIFLDSENGLAEVIVPGMVLAEIGYLSEKKRIQISLPDVKKHIAFFPAFSIYPMDLEVVEKAFLINDIPELHDRLIAGTALLHTLEILTNDPVMDSSVFVKTIWI